MAQEEDQEYIIVKLQLLLSRLATDILCSRPPEIKKFSLSWLESHRKPILTVPEQEELHYLRRVVDKINQGKSSLARSSSSSSDDSFVSPLHPPSIRRNAISSEVFGNWNKKSLYIPKKIAKSNEQRKRIYQVLKNLFILEALSPTELDTLMLAFEEKWFTEGDRVFSQSETSDELYIIESGEFACFRKEDDSENLVKSCGPGEYFGELALLHNYQREFSVVAICDSSCWVLDRNCFINVVREAVQKRRKKYEKIIAGISLFQEVGEIERAAMADALQTVSYGAGEVIIGEGEWGDAFYIIEKGEAVAMKIVHPGKPQVEVKHYGPGGYFGELALLRGVPRAASVVSKTNLQCAVMGRRAFKRLLGPLSEILKRNSLQYKECGLITN